MRWRLIVLGVLTVTLVGLTAFCALQANELFFAGQRLFQTGGTAGPSQAVQDAANRLFQSGYVLQQLVTPLATGAAVSGLAVLALLARRWQVRELTLSRPSASR